MTRKWSGFGSELGRSMIEMLGVLAIVGVLSVGGISGFQKAMNKHKINLVTEELFQFINELLRYSKDLRQVYDQHNGAYTEVTYMFDSLMSGKWRRNGRFIYDSMGNEIMVAVRNTLGKKAVSVRYTLTGLSGETAVNLCMAFYEMVRPYEDMFIRVDVYQKYADNSDAGFYVFSDTYCDGRNKKCFKDLTFAEMLENCNLYRNESGYSSFLFFFPI